MSIEKESILLHLLERSFQLGGGLGLVFLRTDLCLTCCQRVNSRITQPQEHRLGGSSVLASCQASAQDILNASSAHSCFQEQEEAQLPPGFQQRAWEGDSQRRLWLAHSTEKMSFPYRRAGVRAGRN